MARFAQIRGKEAWLEFIREKALNIREPKDSMKDYMNRVASLAGHPGENPGIPSLRDATHELVTQGELESFARGNAKPLKKGGGGKRKRIRGRQKEEGKRASQKSKNIQGNRRSPILDLLLGTVELNSRTNKALALLAGQVANLVERTSPLFEHTKEIEEAKQRLQEVLRETEKMEKTLTNEFD